MNVYLLAISVLILSAVVWGTYKCVSLWRHPYVDGIRIDKWRAVVSIAVLILALLGSLIRCFC